MSRRRPLVPLVPLAIGAAALVSAAGSAQAQQYRGDGGTLLDRNNQIGSGGKNVRARDVRDQIWFNNQIITGNAPSGRSFRGYVGYGATNEFRGPAGSDSQYSFRRDSTAASTVATGIRASDALRYQFSLTTGQAPPSYLANAMLTPRDSNVAMAKNETSTSSALRSTSDFLTSRALRPTLVGSRVDAEGQEWNASASPLLGITWMRVNSGIAPGASAVPLATPAPATPGAPTTPDAAPVTPGAPQPPAMTPSGLESRGMNFRPRWDRSRESGPDAGGPAKPENQLATAVDRSADTSTMPVRSAAHTQVLDAVRTAYGEKGDEPGAAKPDNAQPDRPMSFAEQELERMRRMLRGEPPIPPKKSETAAAPTTPDPLAAPGADKPATTTPGDPAKPPTPVSKRDDKKPLLRESSALSPELLKALKSVGQKNLDTLVPTVSGSTNAPAYRTHMEAGQKELAAGHYFDAEDRFTRAIAAMPNDPLAKIGRIHAQLGAGMFLSASTNLRQLLKDSPEVVGLKFDRKLAPDAERTRKVAVQLREAIDQGSTGMGLEASLLLAYLGRITSDQAMTDEGLAAMGTRLPKDDEAEATLHQLLTGVWGSGAPAPIEK